jgi:hypothetical protein
MAAKPDNSPYSAADLAAIHKARADLYTAQAERRRVMLATGRWQLPNEREPGPVQSARQILDQARAAAAAAGTPKENSNSDL